MVVKVNPHVVNGVTVASQDRSLRNEFHPGLRRRCEARVNRPSGDEWMEGNVIVTCESKQNLSKGSFFLFGFRASEVIRILSSRILPRVSETCLNGNQNGSFRATMLVLPGNSGNVWRFCDEDKVDRLAMGGSQKTAQVPAVSGFWSETRFIGISFLDTSSSSADVRNVRILDCSSKSAKPQGSKAYFQKLPTSRAE